MDEVTLIPVRDCELSVEVNERSKTFLKMPRDEKPAPHIGSWGLAIRPFQQENIRDHPKARCGNPSASSRTGMHESASPPAPLRFRRSARCRLVMTRNDGVGDVSAV